MSNKGVRGIVYLVFRVLFGGVFVLLTTCLLIFGGSIDSMTRVGLLGGVYVTGAPLAYVLLDRWLPARGDTHT